MSGSTKTAESGHSEQQGAPVLSGMDAKLKADWIAALRSGKYFQTRNYLKFRGGYCCLGVLLEIQGFDIEARYPSAEARETTELPLAYGGGLVDETCYRLATMNDGRGDFYGKPQSFSEIADYIEANIPVRENSTSEDRS